MTLSNVRIGTKIFGALGAFALLVVSLAFFNSSAMSRLASTTQGLVGDQAESLKLAANINGSAAKLHQLYLERLVEDEPARIPALRKEITAERRQIDTLSRTLAPFINGLDTPRMVRFNEALRHYDELVAPIEELLGSGRQKQAESRVQRQAGDTYQVMDETLDAIVKQQDDDLDGGAVDAGRAATHTKWTSMVTALGGLVTIIAITLILVRYQITGPLGALQQQMGEIAGGDYRKDVIGANRGDEVGAMARAVQVFRDNGIAKEAADRAKAHAEAEQKLVVDTVSTHLLSLSQGDLTAAIRTDFPSEYAALKTNYNEALGNLRELIGSVAESAVAIRTGSSEIAQASEDLARRTENNAASLEETATSITQIDGRLKASASAASRTVERADQAIDTVVGGRAIADEAVLAMGRVSDSAKGIDSVIEGLDKIAFQTRVLAMNAAVEAGRAGDAGRGFAVVADLVSALAMRAEEEAKRARDQLTVTQIDIITAVEAVQKVDVALADISGDVGQVHELLATMAADNQAQSATITQVSAAVDSMDQSTQQNAAMVEQTSAAARNLASEVTGLAEQAARFKVGQDKAPASRSAPRHVDARSYASSVRPLPAAAIPALIRSGGREDWNAF